MGKKRKSNHWYWTVNVPTLDQANTALDKFEGFCITEFGSKFRNCNIHPDNRELKQGMYVISAHDYTTGVSIVLNINIHSSRPIVLRGYTDTYSLNPGGSHRNIADVTPLKFLENVSKNEVKGWNAVTNGGAGRRTVMFEKELKTGLEWLMPNGPEALILAMLSRCEEAVLRGYVTPKFLAHLLGDQYRIETRAVPTKDEEGVLYPRYEWSRFTVINRGFMGNTWRNTYTAECPWSRRYLSNAGASVLEDVTEHSAREPEGRSEDPILQHGALRATGREICDRCELLLSCTATLFREPADAMKIRVP